MLEAIANVCRGYIESLVVLSGGLAEKVSPVQDDKFFVDLGEGFDVIVDDFSVSADDDTNEGCTLNPREFVKLLDEDSPHGDILDACLDALSQNTEIQPKVRDLTTDGDNDDCEAIFDVDGYGYVILKVR